MVLLFAGLAIEGRDEDGGGVFLHAEPGDPKGVANHLIVLRDLTPEEIRKMLATRLGAREVAPELIMIGYLMIRLVAEIDWSRPEAGIPAFLVIAGVPLTFNISAGIGFGIIGYVVVMVAIGRARAVHPLMWGLVPLFLAFFASDWLTENVF